MVTSLASWPGWSGILRNSRPVGPSGRPRDLIGPARRLDSGGLARTLTGAWTVAVAPPAVRACRVRAGWCISDGRGGRQYRPPAVASSSTSNEALAKVAPPPPWWSAAASRAAASDPLDSNVGADRTSDRITAGRASDGLDGRAAAGLDGLYGRPVGRARAFDGPRATTSPADGPALLAPPPFADLFPLLRNDGMMSSALLPPPDLYVLPPLPPILRSMRLIPPNFATTEHRCG